MQQGNQSPSTTAQTANGAPSSFNGQLTPTGEISVDRGSHQAMAFQVITQPFDQLQQTMHHQRKQPRQKTAKAKTLPLDLDVEGPMSNEAYQNALADQSLTVSPHDLGFLPSNYWLNLDSTFGDLVTKFFQRKNNANCRFPHKLYNALAIVDRTPEMYNLLGVKWVTDEIFKVDKLIFGRVLGISSIDGGLFHRQGNFPSHGFKELSQEELNELKATHDISDVDQDRIRLLHHPLFNKQSKEESVNKCKWSATDKIE